MLNIMMNLINLILRRDGKIKADFEIYICLTDFIFY